jgi:hypothetical protein
MAEEQLRVRYFIDMDWLEANGRSFWTLAQDCLCTDCANRPKKGRKTPTAASLIDTIAGCCAKNSEFITSRMPLLESIFHIFLANGNRPLDLSQLVSELAEWRGRSSVVSESILSRLLSGDRYYGIRAEP